MNHHAKAPSAGSTEATGNSRGLLRCAIAIRGALGRSKGSGAPSSRRVPVALSAALATIAALALTPALALAAPPTTTTPVVSNVSYGTAEVEGKVTTDGSGLLGLTAYQFQVSTDNTNWTPALSAALGNGAHSNEKVEGSLDGLKGGTKYFVRLVAQNGFSVGQPPESVSPAPNPSFTTLMPDPPSVETVDSASEVEYTTAKVTGKILRPEKSDNVACQFEYITDAQFTGNPSGDKYAGATSIPCEPEESVATIGEVPVSASLTGLVNATTYHQRLVVSNAGPTADAKEGPTFTTLTVDPPSVKSIDNATDVEYTTAKVKGVVERPANPDPAFDLNCNFEYVTDAQFAANPPGDKFAGATPVACEGENPIHAEGETEVEATLTGLAGTTKYHLRLSASNLGGSDSKEAAATFTTLTVDPPSVLAINSPTGIDQDSAKVSGEISRPANPDPAFDVNCRFQYVTEAQFNATGFANPGEAVCEPEAEPAENPIHAAGPSKVNARLTGLIPETKYHLRLFAFNPGGSDAKVAATTFTTTQNFPASAVVGPITEVSYNKATLSGEVDPEGYSHFSYAWFDLSTDGVNWTNPIASLEPLLAQTKLTPVMPVVMTGLKGATKYFVRLRLINPDTRLDMAVSQPPYSFFTTLPVDPATVLKVNDATEIGHESAKVSGEIERPANPDPAFDANCRFDYVTDAKFDANGFKDAGQTPCGIDSLTTPEEKKAVEVKLTDLKAGTEYHVRLTATNAGPDASVEIAPFTTTTILPTVKAAAGASDGKAGYTLQGVVNPNNSALSSCEFVYGPNSGLIPSDYAFAVPCSPLPGMVNKPVTVEGHVTGLTPNATYHSRLVVSNKAGTKITEDQIFIPTLDPAETCPNEQLRKENSSLALPECRAYEMVSPPGKEGFGASLSTFDGGDRVVYQSGAGNIARSGQGSLSNFYVASRSEAGWQTIPNLNGSSGSIYDIPSNIVKKGLDLPERYSSDLLSSLWFERMGGSTALNFNWYLRGPDGTFTFIGAGPNGGYSYEIAGVSDDLSHVLIGPNTDFGIPTVWGRGVYEFVGTGNEQPPRRVDVDNSDSPITTCGFAQGASALSAFNSTDGRVALVRVFGGCGGASPPATELWARIGDTTSINVSASQCKRTAADPGGACNGPVGDGGCSYSGQAAEGGPGCRFLTFQGATPDGSRVFFTTRQQLLDADTDESNDLYACDIPAGIPAPTGTANSCSSLLQVSASASEARVEEAKDSLGRALQSVTVSENGSTALFTAKGVLADNEDALKEKAVAGDHNLYAWRTDASHPDGQTTFLGRLDSDDINFGSRQPQATPDGRYLVFSTASQLLDTDTDNAFDLYRYDADTGELTRVSANVFGVAGNGPFDAQISKAAEHNPTTAISDDGTKIVFTTTEPLNLAVDNNDEPDVYLWTPRRVSLITTGAVGGGLTGAAVQPGPIAAIDGSGQDVYFQTRGALTPADGDDSIDVYDARVGGGFSFAQAPLCSGAGGACQSHGPVPAPAPAPESAKPGSEGNVVPKHCPKGKVLKGKKCVKKNKKHHGKKKPHKKNKRTASHGRGGNK